MYTNTVPYTNAHMEILPFTLSHPLTSSIERERYTRAAVTVTRGGYGHARQLRSRAAVMVSRAAVSIYQPLIQVPASGSGVIGVESTPFFICFTLTTQ